MATKPSNAGKTHHSDVGRKIPLSNFQSRAQKGGRGRTKALGMMWWEVGSFPG